MKKYLYQKIYKLERIYRKIMLVVIDLFLIFISIKLCFWITEDINNFKNFSQFLWIRNSFLILSIPFYILSGHYRSLTRYFGSEYFYSLSLRNILLTLLILCIGFFIDFEIPDIKNVIILCFLITIFISFSRIFLRDLVISLQKETKNKTSNVVIYGAGKAGALLALSLRMQSESNILFFVDDNPKLHGGFINGIPIYNPEKIKINSEKISKVLIAIPSISRKACREIFVFVNSLNISVLKVPPIEEITLNNKRIHDLRPLDIEDLLGRESVKPNKDFLGPGIKNFNVCISGAGGSIGSEIVSQLIKLKPKKIILIDNSEFNLYKISKKLSANNNVKTIPLLGDVCNENFLNYVFSNYKIDLLFHVAAYKHVPLVEFNPIQGIRNNVFSTLEICKFSLKYNVKKVMLVSTDKAVRPTNVMGASKRLAENIFQAFDQRSREIEKEKNIKSTKFSMVRFGNVLGSSGSVIPLFEKQVSEGGPITITHPEITRYFMTIEEAAQLVLQASQLSKGGELFLLDMNKPIKIIDLAKQMLLLKGLTLKNISNPEGDIEIKYVGLREGEKLYEELLIDAKASKTLHPLIFKAEEKFIPYEILIKDLILLKSKISKYDTQAVFKLLQKLVPEWQTKKIENK